MNPEPNRMDFVRNYSSHAENMSFMNSLCWLLYQEHLADHFPTAIPLAAYLLLVLRPSWELLSPVNHFSTSPPSKLTEESLLNSSNTLVLAAFITLITLWAKQTVSLVLSPHLPQQWACWSQRLFISITLALIKVAHESRYLISWFSVWNDLYLGRKQSSDMKKETTPNCTITGKGTYGLAVACKISSYK